MQTKRLLSLRRGLLLLKIFILKKRSGYKLAYNNFNPHLVQIGT